ncbi:hypothetical protein [Thalassomonas actiniarum]|uniref:Uncharacterized protein n=1 Tax=Thalassomonas actiniarum TaxID=485447 RepID=A0AAE9YPU1_9GAMM|nr:hypothetical protein [Thalassomonas actiniarum]WDD98820.1 hypothetical protein SG35_026925 [Thalassomonas actiniarum]
MTVNKYLLMLFSLLMLANIAMIFDLQSSVDQDNKPSIKGLQITKDHSAAQQNRLTQLESRFDTLSVELAGISQNINKLAEASTQNNKALAGSQLNKQSDQLLTHTGPLNQEQIFADSIEKVLELGVLDESAWQSMEQDITAMSKAENRAFWETMLAKIAQDGFIITDYEN